MFGKKKLILENNKLLVELSSLHPRVLAIDLLFKEKGTITKQEYEAKVECVENEIRETMNKIYGDAPEALKKLRGLE